MSLDQDHNILWNVKILSTGLKICFYQLTDYDSFLVKEFVTIKDPDEIVV